MRAVKNLLLVLLTLVLVAVSALLPYGTGVMQDRRLESAGDTRELSQVRLLIQQDMSAAQVLTLLGGGYTKMEWDSETNLSASQALADACETVDIMVREGLLPESAYPWYDSDVWSYPDWNGDINALLVISNGENREALLLWEFIWESPDEDAVYTVWIDDATGMLCGFNRTENGVYAPAVVEYADKLVECADQWMAFLGGYYGFVEIDQEIKVTEMVPGEFLDTFVLTLTYGYMEDTQSTCTLEMTFQGGNLSFIC